jgi:hypothetical protein
MQGVTGSGPNGRRPACALFSALTGQPQLSVVSAAIARIGFCRWVTFKTR